jgi:hypothetical protein
MTRFAGTAAAALATWALAGCGSSSHSSPPKTAASTTTPAVAAVNPCALVTSGEVAVALHRAAPPSVKTPISCSYAAARSGVQVRVFPATAPNRQALAQLVAHPAPGARVVRLDGTPLYAAAIAPVGIKPTAQAQVSALRNGTFVTVVLTAPGLSRAQLLARTLVLGRAAVGRL